LARGFSRPVGNASKRYLGTRRLTLALEALRTRLILAVAFALGTVPLRLDALIQPHTGLTWREGWWRGKGLSLRQGVHPTAFDPLGRLRTPLDLADAGFAHAVEFDVVAIAAPPPGARLAADGGATAERADPVLIYDG